MKIIKEPLNFLRIILNLLIIICGVTLTVIGNNKSNDILIGLGTGFITSWLTATPIEILMYINNKKKHKNIFMVATNDLKNLIFDVFGVYNRTISCIDKNKNLYENKNFDELLKYFIEQGETKRKESAPSASNNGELTQECLEAGKKSDRVRKLLDDANPKFEKYIKKAKKIHQNLTMNKLLLLCSDTCTEEEFRAIEGISHILSDDCDEKNKFFDMANRFKDLYEMTPRSIYKKMDLTKIYFSYNREHLDLSYKKRKQNEIQI